MAQRFVTQHVVEPFQELAHLRRAVQACNRAAVSPVRPTLIGNAVRQGSESVLVGGVVADVDGQDVGLAQPFLDPADGSALVPVDARANLEDLLAGGQHEGMMCFGQGVVDHAADFVPSAPAAPGDNGH